MRHWRFGAVALVTAGLMGIAGQILGLGLLEERQTMGKVVLIP